MVANPASASHLPDWAVAYIGIARSTGAWHYPLVCEAAADSGHSRSELFGYADYGIHSGFRGLGFRCNCSVNSA